MLGHRFKSRLHHRQYRLRYSLRGNGARPRLCVFRSARHIYAQVIDDAQGRTIASASTLEKDVRGTSGANVDAATLVGKRVAEAAKQAGVTRVVFDRGGFLFHGRVKALAEAARQIRLRNCAGGILAQDYEMFEIQDPHFLVRHEYWPDSAGAGEWRGGLGQSMEFGIPDGTPFAILAMFDRVDNPAKGRGGGANGAAGEVALASGRALRSKGQQTIPAGDRLRLELPGGGGHGDPRTRDAERVAEDVRDGLVSPEAAHDDYGVALDDDGAVDSMATEKIRSR